MRGYSKDFIDIVFIIDNKTHFEITYWINIIPQFYDYGLVLLDEHGPNQYIELSREEAKVWLRHYLVKYKSPLGRVING